MNLRHLISPDDLSVSETDVLLRLGDAIAKNPAAYADRCRGKKIATLFFEPSTRTRLSFEAAMLELGGGVLGFSSPDSSSVAKGETVADTIRTVQCFADLIAIRHPKEGAATVAAQSARIPVVNAGDGGHLHPTQTLTDLLTIRSLNPEGWASGLTVGLCGDLMFGRTVHSLVRALMMREGMRFVFISPGELRMPAYILDELQERNIPYTEKEILDDDMPELDVLYMTRVQKERFFNEEDYVRLRDSYILDSAKIRPAKEGMIILHPLPRLNEIAVEVDSDPRAAYFKQVLYGKYARMALILMLLGLEDGLV